MTFLFQEMTSELLPQVLPWIMKGLQDGDDDVRAVAASALLPVSEELVTALPTKVRTRYLLSKLPVFFQ